MGILEGKEREKEEESIFEEIVAKSFPNLIKDMDPPILEAQLPQKTNTNRIHLLWIELVKWDVAPWFVQKTSFMLR